jgi:hypothetical protein
MVNFETKGFVIANSKIELLFFDGLKTPSIRVPTVLAKTQKHVPKQKVHIRKKETRRKYRFLMEERF